MPTYRCQWCRQPLSTESARDQHEANCSENPANESTEDE